MLLLSIRDCELLIFDKTTFSVSERLDRIGSDAAAALEVALLTGDTSATVSVCLRALFTLRATLF